MASPLIVLTASSTEASEWHHSIWQQMMSAAVPYKLSNTLFNKVFFANESWPDGRAKYVPNGLRMVETLLLREYPEEDVVTCYVSELEKFVGPETKVLAIHAHNPLGISYATDIYAKIFGENLTPLNAHEFLKIVTHPVIRKYRPKIVIGGPGAWQLEKANRLDQFKINYLIDGEIERVFNDLFNRICKATHPCHELSRSRKRCRQPLKRFRLSVIVQRSEWSRSREVVDAVASFVDQRRRLGARSHWNTFSKA